MIDIRPVEPDLLRVAPPPYSLYRADGGESRWYYSPEVDRYFPSVTSVIQATTPTPFALLEWMKTNGREADDLRDERAAYGTFLHAQIARLLTAGEYDLNTTAGAALAAAMESGDSRLSSEWCRDAQKDILAFEQFRRDTALEPMGVEVMLVSAKHGYAGAIDLPCWLTLGKGKNAHRTTAIVDLKSGRKGFYEAHEIQLHMYRVMWNENYPDLLIERVLNWAPKDWRLAPTYHLKDQTDSPSRAKIPYLLGQFRASQSSPPQQLVIGGRITPAADLDDLYRFESIRDHVLKTKSK